MTDSNVEVAINQERFLFSIKSMSLRKEQETKRDLGERVQEEVMKNRSHDHLSFTKLHQIELTKSQKRSLEFPGSWSGRPT